jgi:tetratricopeptide (TPR) repeat protein/predicted Ser/Thr protein kinase
VAEDATLADASIVSDGGRADQRLARGETVGRYVVLSTIGAGGMGVVYNAYDPELDRKIALKLLHAAADAPATRRRLLGEAQAMARLSHRNTVAIHDVGEHAGRVFLALELVEGVTLRQWLRGEARDRRDVVRVLLDAARGLAGAHRAGIVHRDFKPDNVFVANDGAVKVGDFGLAVMVDDVPTDASVPGRPPEIPSSQQVTRWVGTPPYMAPEQHRRTSVTAATDQFAFCVTACEALFGARPFAGDNANEVASAILEGRVTLPRSSRGMSARLRRAIVRGLLPQPEQRWPSMDALVAEIEAATRPRHARAIALAAVTIAGFGFGVVQLDRSQRERECERRGEQTRAVWSDAVAEQAEASLRAAGIETGDLFTRIGPRLDAYAAELGRLRTLACTQVEVDRDRTPAWRASVDECLDEGHASVTTLVGVFADPSEDTGLRAVSSVLALPLLTACTDERVLERRPVPHDATQRALVAALRDELAAIRLLDRAGRASEAAARTVAVASTARALDYPPLSVEVADVEASLAKQTGENAKSAAILEEAYYLALSAASDEQALRCATELVLLHGHELRQRAIGLVWARTAQALADRVGLADDAHAASLSKNLGSLYHAAGELAASVAAHERALALREQLLGEEHPDVAQSIDGLANAYSVRGDGKEAVALHQRGLAIRERVFGPTHPTVAESYGNLCAAYGRMGDLEASIAACKRGLAISDATLGPNHPAAVLSASNLGVALSQRGRYDEALQYAERVLAIERSIDPSSPDTALSLNNVGDVHLKLGNTDHALEHFTRARTLLETGPGKDHEVHAHVIENLARVYLYKADYPRALEEAEEALALRVRVFGEPSTPVARSRLFVAGAAMALEDWARARSELARVQAAVDAGTVSRAGVGDGLPLTTGAIAMHDRDFDRAVATFETLAADMRAAGRGPHDVGQATMHIALARIARGDAASEIRPLVQDGLRLLQGPGADPSDMRRRGEAWLAANPG